MLEPVTIVADDLTGALDAAVAGAGRGACVVLGTDVGWPDRPVVAVDTGSRHASPDEARMHVAAAIARARRSGRIPFLKIDSLLRGNVGTEIAAALDALAAPHAIALVAPAFPDTGRTTVGGVVHVHGAPDLGGSHAGRIEAALAAGGLQTVRATAPAEHTGLAHAVRRAAEQGAHAVVVDATTDEHLADVVAAARLLDIPTLLVGSGGLAAQLLGPAPAAPRVRLDPVPRVLSVVGSHAPLALAQVETLVTAGGRRILPDTRSVAGAGDLVLTPDPGLPVDAARTARTAAALGSSAAAIAAGFGALVLTGGETARAVLDALGVRRLDVVAQLEPGVVLSRAPGLPALIVTKAGAFGDAGSLERIRSLLHAPS